MTRRDKKKSSLLFLCVVPIKKDNIIFEGREDSLKNSNESHTVRST